MKRVGTALAFIGLAVLPLQGWRGGRPDKGQDL